MLRDPTLICLRDQILAGWLSPRQLLCWDTPPRLKLTPVIAACGCRSTVIFGVQLAQKPELSQCAAVWIGFPWKSLREAYSKDRVRQPLWSCFCSWHGWSRCRFSHCWWFRNPARKPVEVGSLCYYLQGFMHPRVVSWGFFHQPQVLIHMLVFHIFSATSCAGHSAS